MGLVDSSADGRFEPAVPKLSLLGAIGASADLLVEAVRTGRAPLECDIPAGATRFYPDTVSYLATLMSTAAEAVAEYLSGADQILDVGAGAAPWSLVLRAGCTYCGLTVAACWRSSTSSRTTWQ
jgi:hypothetical protein